MPPTSNGDVVLYLLDGRSDRQEVVLAQGQSVPPFAAGRDVGWRVSATEVVGAHVLFAFNGARLFVCALRGAPADLDGAPLDARWTEAAVPSELRFGGARIRIGRPTAQEEAPEPTLVSVDAQEHAQGQEAPHAADGDATRIVDLQTLAANARARAQRDAATTCLDEARLQAALRLCAAAADEAEPDAVAKRTWEPTKGVPSSRAPASRPVPWTAMRRPQVRLARRDASTPDAPPTAASLTRSERMTTALLAGLDAPRRRAFERSAGEATKPAARAR
jgi:hypothetical protein